MGVACLHVNRPCHSQALLKVGVPTGHRIFNTHAQNLSMNMKGMFHLCLLTC